MLLSDCCDAPVYGEGDWICSKCKEHCDVYEGDDDVVEIDEEATKNWRKDV